jgi:hypothetical protein
MTAQPTARLDRLSSAEGRPTKTRAAAEAGTQNGHSYKPLATEYHRPGFSYRQIAREGDAAIYEQRWTGCADQAFVTKWFGFDGAKDSRSAEDLLRQPNCIQIQKLGEWTVSRSRTKTRRS